jgi:flagellin
MPALNAQRSLEATSLLLGRSVERLASGFRINRAADDAAGLSISEKLRAQVRGVAQAQRNAQDGVSMIQTAEGSLATVHSMLQRMRELAVQASNDTLSDADRSNINLELQALKNEINGISSRVKFNGKQLLTGALATTLGGATATDLVVGDTVAGGTESATATTIDVSTAKPNATYTFTGTGASLTLTRSTDNVAQTITASNIAASGTGVLNFDALGVKVTLSSTAGMTAANQVTGLIAAANDTIVTTGPGAANFQIGSDPTDVISVGFTQVDVSATGLSALNTGLGNFNTTQTVANAQALITAVDTSITSVNTTRATLGSVQNRLEYTISNLGVIHENLMASESRIRDADMAEEMVAFTKAQILSQAGTAILAQANQAPQAVLALLR